MLTVSTTRFGDILIEEDRVIHFPEGLLGFPDQKAFIIQQHKPGSFFYWLQSINLPYLAFVIINPFLGEKDYLKELPPSDQLYFNGIEDGHTLALALVTIKPESVPPLTMNLVGPVIINLENRIGRQVVLSTTRFSCRHPLVLAQ
ncbi:MAG: flagellar assembly protein FliW [Deltaproteobacteria bacterium]|nr:flagellar assembly protein FliW [Deltaproteobacteria bacterium]